MVNLRIKLFLGEICWYKSLLNNVHGIDGIQDQYKFVKQTKCRKNLFSNILENILHHY